MPTTPSAAAAPERGVGEDTLLVLVTCPPDHAEAIARGLVEAGLAACVNQVPGLRSTYRWQGQVQTDDEALLLAKTTAPRFEALRARVLELHPYELPEVIAVPVTWGHAPYLEWIAQCTEPG